MKGTVKFFNEPKHFGFITAEDGKDYFVHDSGLKENVTITDDDAVIFDIEDGDRGSKAINVSLANGADTPAAATVEEVAEEEKESSEDF
jgi:CspA family cold shock protein